MNNQLNKPKGFGEILDLTFRLSKNHFSNFILIFLVIMGPLYLLQSFVELLSGTSFFREVGTGSNPFEQFASSFDIAEAEATSNLGADLGIVFLGLLTMVVLPFAYASILIAVNDIKKGLEFTVKDVMKRAFSEFWTIFGSSLLFGLLFFSLVFVPLFFIIIIGVIGAVANPIVGIILSIILFLAVAAVAIFLLTRWSFFLGAVVFEQDAPGLGRSWRLTRKRTWFVIGLYIVLFLITFSISISVETVLGMLLGYSVLFTVLVNVVALVTSMFLAVGYAIVYLDLKARHDADDLKELIDDYNSVNN
ncbi:glycerophosphoryl diester phosphodiesterase membrane domain-containing protein [Aquibacillus rhizosphaerae]|uniref:Glycerophosphoryl diester phosphodiesterase membrane domain-containing protein n=1 Tax=Aquibacillus rhizosphaerae TaxID=3051431 RepID=A0ABT7L663_9BACI|nr:glycerophosphoryl diester phosphodiesterase membrane domain-containing protein [Aquibacillus sp. LR5S19]MDL4840697.1 glycerophosphoryl diester phosphodiesterase membrane domain-containing protein [Aquibacillus sp. LR5S19]